MILGTGLGPLVQYVRRSVVIPSRDLPGVPRTTVLAHRGRSHSLDVPPAEAACTAPALNAVRHFLWPISPEIAVVLGAPAVGRPQPRCRRCVSRLKMPHGVAPAPRSPATPIGAIVRLWCLNQIDRQRRFPLEFSAGPIVRTPGFDRHIRPPKTFPIQRVHES
jgi:hypothetical protein